MSLWTTMSEVAGSIASGGRSLLAALGAGSQPGVPQTDDDRKAQTGVTFTIAVVALSAKMAKADGVVLGVEKEAFYRAFHVAPEDLAAVERVFSLAEQDTAGFTNYADSIARALAFDAGLLGDVLDSLFHIATADRALHPGEDAFLAEVARRFGFTDSAYRHHRAQFVIDKSSPYEVLGLDPAVSDEDIKRRHRKLVRENHPDVFIGRGVPPETVELATRRLAAINEAYRAIARDRRL